MNGATGIVFTHDRKKVLLIKRRDIPIWVLPGGKIEKGETPQQAVVRELLEETGLKVSVIRKTAEYTYIDKTPPTIQFLFECRAISGKLSTGPETKDINYFGLRALPSPIHPGAKVRIGDALKRKKVIKRNIRSLTVLDALKHLNENPVVVIRFILTKVGIHLNT